jgi:mono/diheme cytochrome c family protein
MQFDLRHGRNLLIARQSCHVREGRGIKMSRTTSFPFATAAVTALCAVFAIDIVSPALAADAFNGKRLAERWCAACHVVTVSQQEGSADAPPFEEIAKQPNFNESGLVTFLLNPHSKMPNMNLTRIEAGDIAAYIRTLR